MCVRVCVWVRACVRVCVCDSPVAMQCGNADYRLILPEHLENIPLLFFFDFRLGIVYVLGYKLMSPTGLTSPSLGLDVQSGLGEGFSELNQDQTRDPRYMSNTLVDECLTENYYPSAASFPV